MIRGRVYKQYLHVALKSVVIASIGLFGSLGLGGQFGNLRHPLGNLHAELTDSIVTGSLRNKISDL